MIGRNTSTCPEKFLSTGLPRTQVRLVAKAQFVALILLKRHEIGHEEIQGKRSLDPPTEMALSRSIDIDIASETTALRKTASLAMSYITAIVQFTDPGGTYPVECFRTDITAGDEVLVELRNRGLKPARVVQLRFHNWSCTGRIVGKVSEAVLREDGSWEIGKAPSVVGLVNNEAFVAELERLGWVPLKPGHVHAAVLTNSNQTASANILVRKNGIDLHILPTRRSAMPERFGQDQDSLAEGRVVRHHFAHTTFNLYEGILRFAASFMSDEGDYERFFKPVGVRKWRPWAVVVRDIPAGVSTISDIPDFTPGSLGSRAHILRAIHTVLPFADYSDSSLVRVDLPEISIEISIGEGDPVGGFECHVRHGEFAGAAIAEILEQLGAGAFYLNGGDGLFDGRIAERSRARWQQYKAAAVSQA